MASVIFKIFICLLAIFSWNNRHITIGDIYYNISHNTPLYHIYDTITISLLIISRFIEFVIILVAIETNAVR